MNAVHFLRNTCYDNLTTETVQKALAILLHGASRPSASPAGFRQQRNIKNPIADGLCAWPPLLTAINKVRF